MDREVCVSEGVREFTRGRAHMSARKLVVIPNPVEPLAPSRPRDEVRASLARDADELVILSVGGSTCRRATSILSMRRRASSRRTGNALFVVAGEGDRREDLEGDDSQARRLADGSSSSAGGATWRTFTTPRTCSSCRRCGRGCRIRSSRRRRLALPISRRPSKGSREVIEDGRTGLLVPPRDSGALRGALERLTWRTRTLRA